MQGITIIKCHNSNGCLYVEFERQNPGGGFTAFRLQLAGSDSFIEENGDKTTGYDYVILSLLDLALSRLEAIYPQRINTRDFQHYAQGFADGYKLAEVRR